MPRKYVDIAGSGRIQVADGYSLRSARLQSVKRQSSLAEPTQDLIQAMGGVEMLSGERVDVSNSLAISDVFAAVSIIAETIATLPLRVYRRTLTGEVLEAPDHRANLMLGIAPNPVMPSHRFWATVAGHLLLWGNAFIEKLRDESGLVSEIWLVHPSLVTVEFNAALKRKRYTIEVNGIREVFDDDRMLHIIGYSTDGLVGLSPIQQCRQQLGMVKARERFEGDVYARKPYLSGVIEHPQRLTDTVKLRESWEAIYGGGDRGFGARSHRHSVAVLEEGAHFIPLTAPMADMQFVESQQMSKRNIAAMFKLPPSYLGGSTGDSLTYQTVESNKIQLATMAIAPVTTNIQKFLGFDRGLFPFPSWYPEFVMEGMLRGDSTARAAFYKAMSEVKAILPNEIRALENMPPRPGGDEFEQPVVPAAFASEEEDDAA
jgi:HK97 family phage portal protein